MSDSTAESQSTHPGRRNNSAGSGQTKNMRRMIDVAPGAPAAGGHRTRRRVNACVLYEPEIDHQSVITNSEAAAVMSPASDGKEEIIFSGKVYGMNNIGHIRTTRNQARFLVDHRIVNFASIVV